MQMSPGPFIQMTSKKIQTYLNGKLNVNVHLSLD